MFCKLIYSFEIPFTVKLVGVLSVVFTLNCTTENCGTLSVLRPPLPPPPTTNSPCLIPLPYSPIIVALFIPLFIVLLLPLTKQFSLNPFVVFCVPFIIDLEVPLLVVLLTPLIVLEGSFNCVSNLEVGGSSGTIGNFSYRHMKGVVRVENNHDTTITTFNSRIIGKLGSNGTVSVVDVATGTLSLQVTGANNVNNSWSAVVYLHELKTNATIE